MDAYIELVVYILDIYSISLMLINLIEVYLQDILCIGTVFNSFIRSFI